MGSGAVVSLTYKAAVDDPDRFKKSKSVGAFFGLRPKRYQSGPVTAKVRKMALGSRSQLCQWLARCRPTGLYHAL